MSVTLIINYNDKTSSRLHGPRRDLVFNSSCFHTLAINPELVYLEKLGKESSNRRHYFFHD